MAVLAVIMLCSCEPEEIPDDSASVNPVPQPQELKLAPAKDTVFEAGGIRFDMKYVRGGMYTMGATTQNGSPYYDPDADILEQPPHQVMLDAFLIADIEVSQFLFYAVMGFNPSLHSDLTLPVHNVSFTNAQRFVDTLSKVTGYRFRLPTEAEWEYAAKGGGQSGQNYLFAGSSFCDSVAWSSKTSNEVPHVSGQLNPNALGLYDMSGNVMEWCTDWYGEYGSSPQTNPQGPDMPSNVNIQKRCLRGGSYMQSPYYLRNTARQFAHASNESSEIGFRIVISVEKQ